MDPIRLLRLFALALACWREARGESALGKLLVCQVVENRVRDPRWPETYIGVITQRWQFSAFNADDPNALKFPTELDPSWPDCVAAAEAVINSPTPITTANHYVVDALRPRPQWFVESKVVARDGAHVFLCL